MLEKIKKAIAEIGASAYSIDRFDTESIELFFVKKKLDMRRAKEITTYSVTVYADEDGKRGSSITELGSNEEYQDIIDRLQNAYASAKSALNPFYELPDPEVGEETTPLMSLSQTALDTAKATFAPTTEKAFVNSLEIFAVRKHVRKITSKGTDVSYWKQYIEGEYVVQCKDPQDVELYNSFKYQTLDEKSHSQRVLEALQTVESRAQATASIKSGEYDVIIDEENLASLISEYLLRTNVAAAFAGYVDSKAGDDIQGQDATGEKLNLTLKATAPYDQEGIKLKDTQLLKDGVIQTLIGANRFCYYLGMKPTGTFDSICLQNGSKPLSEMLKGKVVYVKTFSDFQADGFSGSFGGEIRLGYLYENGKAIPFTGGSISGNLLNVQKNFVFSTEKYEGYDYVGPKAVKLSGVIVAGE